MPLINPTRSALYLIQQETLPITPAGFIEVNTPLVVVPNFQTVETNRLSGAMNSKETVVDTCRTMTSFLASVNMRESGAVLTEKSEYAELLKISGFEETVGADTYTLSNQVDAIARGSARVYMDGQRFDMTNTLVGSTEMLFEVGSPAVINTTLTGYLDSATPTPETNPTPELNQNGLLIVSCADVITIDGTIIPAQAIGITTNPEIANIYTMGGAEGHKSDVITDYGLLLAITFPVDSAVFGREASLIETGQISAIRIVLNNGSDGTPVNGESVVIMADTARAVTYEDEVNEQLLQRILSLRLYDDLPTSPAITITTGNVSAL